MPRSPRLRLISSVFRAGLLLSLLTTGPSVLGDDLFRDQVAPLLGRRCLSCHNEVEAKGGLSLASRDRALAGGDGGASIVPGDESSSWLLDMVDGDDPEMPKDSDPLTRAQIEVLQRWIRSGADWPAGVPVEDPVVTDLDWWSLRPLDRPAIPSLTSEQQAWVRTPVDAFVYRALASQGLAPSPPADRRTLARRLYFDLIGLPPTPEQIDAFENDDDPRAYERLVEELLDSPHYGERWARRWLDIVHYGDTHGYDKDKPRPNAWPYRDYVIRSFNDDKPYERFVREQLAGDVLWPDSRDAIEATGFIAAGPWDFIGHAEVAEDKIDGQVARNLDRDDMVSSTFNTFLSTTIQCARCHNHKFDPIRQEHYYSLQAVFAALDRADRSYDLDSSVARQRAALQRRQRQLLTEQEDWENLITRRGGEPLARLRKRITELESQLRQDNRPEYGYHSQIVAEQDSLKWVQIDLGSPQVIAEIVLIGADDDFNGIGAGFGFPVRYRIELSNDPSFETGVTSVGDFSQEDQPNPGTTPQATAVGNQEARYVRITATKLALRADDYIFALAEAKVLAPDGENLAAAAAVSALDSIEAPPRWGQSNLTDSIHAGATSSDAQDALAMAQHELQDVLAALIDTDLRAQESRRKAAMAQIEGELKGLPPQHQVYAGMVYAGSGAFRGRGYLDGKPRDVFVLHRGQVTAPLKLVRPGTAPLIASAPTQFDLPENAPEGARRVALADWIVRRDNPLTWRSIVNRIWLYHFGNGIVASANDFGRMGEKPTHPELLDWLATDFRDNGQSLKNLHRMLVLSNTYRQSSAFNPAFDAIDAGNRYLWRMNRRGLEAEEIRDAVLQVSGKLNPSMYGPGFQDFVVERPEHSPHYQYHMHDPDDIATHRRSVYRFLVRSQQQPFMETLDCADPSISVARRDTTVTALQALTMLNNRFTVRMAEHFAARLTESSDNVHDQMMQACRLALGRYPTPEEHQTLVEFTETHGLANTCRLVFNLNEFMFID